MAMLEAEKLTLRELARRSEEAHKIFDVELRASKLLALDRQEVQFYDHAFEMLTIEAQGAFPSVFPELDEAGKCYALGRFTACVAHLMRAIEIPMQVLGKTLLPDDPKPNWEPILQKIEAEERLPFKERTVKEDIQFLAEIAVHLRSIKFAWRNPGSHAGPMFSPDRAKSVFDVTIGVLNHLATRLKEPTQEVVPAFVLASSSGGPGEPS